MNTFHSLFRAYRKHHITPEHMKAIRVYGNYAVMFRLIRNTWTVEENE